MAMKPLEGTIKKNSIITVNPPLHEDTRTIVVLGVERGGTSMVAGMLRALGIDFGDKVGRNHEDPKFLTDDKEKLLHWIKKYNSKKPVWGFKVPKASLMLDFYDRHLRNPHYVLVFRNIEAIVDSWCSRGANDPMRSALHAMHYYGSALNYLKDRSRPLAFVSYERACDEPEIFARNLANFIGLKANDELIEYAASIVTGEGGGYLDLPEFYFHIEALLCEDWPEEKIDFEISEESRPAAMVSRKKVKDRLILMPSGKFFPKEFLIGFDLLSPSQDLLAEQGLRVYMDFTGDFFPGHAFRPPIRKGRNLLRISTNGNVRRIALGGMRAGYKFGLEDVVCYKATDGRNELNYEILNQRKAPFLARMAHKFRRKWRKK